MAKPRPRDLAAWFGALPRVARIALPVVLGAVAALGHEDLPGSFILVLISFVLALLIVPVTRRSAGWFGWLLGLGYFAVTLRWIIEPFLVDIPRHGWMAPFAIALMAGGLALFWALAFWAARGLAGPGSAGQGLAGRGGTVMLWLPLTLTAAELARGHIWSGFPWGMLSYTLVGGVGDMWLSWVGPHGTGLLLVGLAGTFAYCLHRGRTLVWIALGVVPAATVGLHFLASTTPVPMTDKVVRVIQPNAPQHQKWDPDWMGVFFDRAVSLTRDGDGADVVIWPESSVPTRLSYAGPFLEQMSLAARGAPVVAGIQRSEGDDYFNSLIVLDGPSEVSAIYDKAHLVPFGEYIPLAWLLEPMGFGTLVEQVAGFSRGQGDGVVQVDGLGLARVLICYEGIFPEEIQRGSIRPDILLILTNDAWFGNGPGPRQHLVQAQARAIEQGLPVIRSANTGISAVIDARGNIRAHLPLNQSGALDAQVPGPLAPTLYGRMGDWPLTGVLGLAIIGGASLRRRFAVDDRRSPA